MASPLTSLADIEQAAARIRGTVVRTPLIDVSRQYGRPLWLKAENLQMAGSFKLRGAHNMICRLSDEARQGGVITYSSGNHAQAVAYAARSLGVEAVVVMPVTAPDVKVAGARRFGAEVLMEGTTSLERRARAEHEAGVRGLTVVPPFDHPDIIAGQGTVGSEILEDCSFVNRIYVPVGGGGLVAGLSAAVKRMQPGVRVVGVEPVGAAKMSASLEAGRPVVLDAVSALPTASSPCDPEISRSVTLKRLSTRCSRLLMMPSSGRLLGCFDRQNSSSNRAAPPAWQLRLPLRRQT